MTPSRERRYVDGALLHALRLPFGYWEGKDEKDDLDARLRRNYAVAIRRTTLSSRIRPKPYLSNRRRSGPPTDYSSASSHA
jgi:hypothetical protein